jgi:hypothetical protein
MLYPPGGSVGDGPAAGAGPKGVMVFPGEGAGVLEGEGTAPASVAPLP